MYFAEFKGVYFIEGSPQEAITIEQISSELNGFFSQNQLKSLDDLKEKMREYVVHRGGNCVIDFKYGQRSTFWKSLLGMDDVLWYGTGKIAKIDTEELNKYKIKN
jgi:hypothetical protein